MTFKIRVVERKCIGSGQCVLAAPDLFDQDDDGIVVLKDATPPAARHEAARKAAHLCPSVAIFVDEDAG
jgi:ferredoxin